MFEDSLTESSKGLKGLRRAGATILLLAIQVAIVASIVVVPMWHTQALSARELTLAPKPDCRLGDPGIRPIYWHKPTLDNGLCQALPIITGTNSLCAPDQGTRCSHGCRPATPFDLRVVTTDVGVLVHRVPPVYPTLAKAARVQGHVVMQATIGKDGRIRSLSVISGHPMLVSAAIDAVRQWRYRPHLLNNSPVEVETRIEVNFEL